MAQFLHMRGISTLMNANKAVRPEWHLLNPDYSHIKGGSRSTHGYSVLYTKNASEETKRGHPSRISNASYPKADGMDKADLNHGGAP